MKFDARQLIEVLGVAAVVLSLVFVGSELRLSRSVASTENLNVTASNNIAMKALITENIEVWQKGCMGEELTDVQATLFTQLVQAVDTLSFLRWRNSQGDISGLPEVQAPLGVALSMHRFPGFRNTWRSALSQHASQHPITINSRGGGVEGWRNEIERLYALLEESQSSPNRDLTLCGLF